VIVERPGLLTRYEALRQKTVEGMTAFVDTLGKVDGLPPDQLEQARDALFHADHPYLAVFLGAFNTGKSSLINALIGENVLSVGATPTTDRIAILRHGSTAQTMGGSDIQTIFHPTPLLERVSLVDTPGLDSVFKGHDAITGKFLHRADLVFHVMLATQAMSASNREYLESLRDYGKRVIVVINQIDLVDEGERGTLQSFVTEQVRAAFGVQPQVWLVSSRLASEAQKSAPRDSRLWEQSGFSQFETYLNRALSDVERARQKLETPLQIARNVMSAANIRIREQQDALAEYRRSAANVRGQIDAAQKEQDTTVREVVTALETAFDETALRGKALLRETFQWSKVFPLLFSGLGQVIRFPRLFRRRSVVVSRMLPAAERARVIEPLTTIPPLVERVPPRLEGRDVKDTDDLVLYAQRELERLPGALRGKVIGDLTPPARYDRTLWDKARDDLSGTLEKAQQMETDTLDGQIRMTAGTLVVYLLSILIMGCLLLTLLSVANQGNSAGLLIVAMFAAMLGGIAALPLRGWLMANAYGRRLEALKREYSERFMSAAREQISYGRQLRGDAVAPFLRMVETYLSQADTIKAELAAHTQQLTELEKSVSDLKG